MAFGAQMRVMRTPEGGVIPQFREGFRAGMVRAWTKLLLRMEREIRLSVRNLLGKNPTGALARSFQRRLIFSSASKITASVFSKLPYAAIQHYGGEVLPRTVLRLAIPLPGAGVPRGAWPRDYPFGDFYDPNARFGITESVLIHKATGKPWYALKFRSYVPGTHYLTDAMDRVRPYVREEAKQLVRIAVKRERSA